MRWGKLLVMAESNRHLTILLSRSQNHAVWCNIALKYSNRWTIVLACTYMIGSNRSLQHRWLSANNGVLYKVERSAVQHCSVAGLYWWVLVVTVGEQASEVSTRPTLVWCILIECFLRSHWGYTEQLSSYRQYLAIAIRHQDETAPVGQCRRY